MTYHRIKDEMTEVQANVIPIYHPIMPTRTKQFCKHESDERLRAMVRGMDDRERMVILDEIGRIYKNMKRALH